MLTLTNNAQDAVRTLTKDPQAPERAGLRIAAGNQGLELMLVAEPAPGDALIDDDEGGSAAGEEPAAGRAPRGGRSGPAKHERAADMQYDEPDRAPPAGHRR